MAEEGRGRIWHTKSAINNLSDDSSSGAKTTRDDEATGSGSGSGSCSGSGAGSKTGTINVHNPAVSYGGIDPEIEENVLLVKSVPAHDARWDARDRRRNQLDPDSDDDLDIPSKRRITSTSTSRGSWIHASIPHSANNHHVLPDFVYTGAPDSKFLLTDL